GCGSRGWTGAGRRARSGTDPSAGASDGRSQVLLALPTDPDLRAVLLDALPHPRRLVARPAHDLHVRDVHEQLRVDDAGLLELRAAAGLLARGALVLLRARDALHHDAALAGQHVDDAAGLAAVLAVHHPNVVVLLDVDARHGYNTSGASEM